MELPMDLGASAGLACPRCGCDNLHQITCEAFFRSEDDEHGIRAYSGRDRRVMVDTNMERNPSLRRDGIRIRFVCEQCSETRPLDESLCIVQHKGTTYLYWDVVLS